MRGKVEIFIVEKVVSMHGAGGQDLALQLTFIIKDRKISEAVENMKGYKTRDWELFKKEYEKNSIPKLISKYTEKGDNGLLEEDGIQECGNPLWNAILAKMQRDMAREIAHNKELRQTKDGKGLIPKLDELNEYVGASCSILALGVSAMGAKKKVETNNGKLPQLQEEIDKLRTESNTSQNTRALPPHFSSPIQPEVGLRPMGGGSYQRPQIQCYYCKEEVHTVWKDKLSQ
ncbi:hypothetical protein VP01_7834g1 [Puccinia sorghi]|uniref:Uncharacterized protein n=1 Tax=Puccinia sorghi TaxID=27349 RepID=A0A0L6UBX3_9BASI|nr:hypothetical protein VP01_7834g1 [Puccinia sorghi]